MKSKILILAALIASFTLTGCSYMEQALANAVYEESDDKWSCRECHTTNSGAFCSNCGAHNPEQEISWACSCGAVNEGNFCSSCGERKAGTASTSTGSQNNDTESTSEHSESTVSPVTDKVDTTSTVSATLHNPAKLGEWTTILKYSGADSGYHTCYMRLTNNVRGAAAERVMDEYNASHKFSYFEELDDSSLEWGCLSYEIYFPADYPANDWGISTPDVNIALCNQEGGGVIAGYLGLSSAWDVSDDSIDCYPGDTFYGQTLYVMSKDCDNYLVTYDAQDCEVYFDPT